MKISYKKLWVMLIEREIPKINFTQGYRAVSRHDE